ncbi:MAG: hypothetical protein WCL14_09460 [Bacteroidota bacterium]
MKRIILIALMINFGFVVAQEIKITNATSQNWSGGVCCRYGTKFVINFQTANVAIIPDTVWINGYYYPLIFQEHALWGTTRKYDSLNRVFVFNVEAGESHDDARSKYPEFNQAAEDSVKKNYPKAPSFTGVALFTYPYKGKQCSFTVKEFKRLKPLIYP